MIGHITSADLYARVFCQHDTARYPYGGCRIARSNPALDCGDLEGRTMTSTAEQIRTYQGPAILSYGFRPFFLAGAAWAALTVALWLPMLNGQFKLPTAFSPIAWHVHELIYGYVPAVIAGFLLTAVPNWTGRLPVVGGRLLALFLVWLIGRVAILTSLWTDEVVAACLDSAFLAVLGLVIAREIAAGENWRNMKVLVALAALFVGNVVFHVEAVTGSGDGYGIRIGIAATVFLIMLIGGRIIPSFTRNWLARRDPGRLPIPFNSLDIGIIAVSIIALIGWIVAPNHGFTALLLIVAGLANFARLARWAGERTLDEPLVVILHIAYAFVPVGFVLLALATLQPEIVTSTGAVHGWTAGAIPLMTLAVMTRASLGHTGQELTANRLIQFLYLAAIISACARIAAGFDFLREPMLFVSSIFWVLAFAGLVAVYGPMLTKPSSSS